MIFKYSATLAIVVIFIAYGLSTLLFATRSQVLSGKTVDETLKFEFTVDADSDHTYKIGPDLKQFIENNIQFHGEGPARVISSTVEITPKDVSWTRDRTNYTSPGAAMTAHVQWDTPAGSANGSSGGVYMDFPELPGFAGATTSFHSGGYQREGGGRYLIREITTYRSDFPLAVARFVFALAAGLPIGILLHTIGWAFVLKGEKRLRIAAFPPQGTGLPQTYYPNPVAEWSAWLLALGLGDMMSSVFAGLSLSDGFISSDMRLGIYCLFAATLSIALISVFFTRRNVLTVCVAAQGIAYARGRVNLNWLNAAWSNILTATQKSRTYRGNTRYWIEVAFADKRKKLKIPQSIVGYPALRGTVSSMYAAAKQADPSVAPYRG